MPFDGGYLHKIAQEIEQAAANGARIDKISQPSRELLLITLRTGAGSRRLLLSAAPAAPKIHFTEMTLENPKTPPMFCMLLRRRLGSGRLLRVEQEGMDRILTIVFECVNELGDRVELGLACEIMGRHSNIILVDQNRKIIDAIRRVDFVTSEQRPILPGMTYTPPPAQDKLNLLAALPSEAVSRVTGGRDLPLSRALLEQIQGLSPMVCREVSHFVCGGTDETVSCLMPAQLERLEFYLSVLRSALLPGGGRPTVIHKPDGTPHDFSYLSISQFGDGWQEKTFESFSALLDSFYGGQDAAEEMRHKSLHLLKTMTNTRDRLARKLAAQGEELEKTSGRETCKQWGDLISANLYRITQGDTVLEAENFYDPDGGMVSIPLDPTRTPSRNAQKYYAEYRKAATAEKKLLELIGQGQTELEYLESVIAQIRRAKCSEDLTAIRQELSAQGYLRKEEQRGAKPVRLSPLRYRSSDGLTILCGRNNLQNDQITLRDAHGFDLWLHTQKIHGSHVIVQAGENREIPLRTIEEASVIAAVNSSAGTGTKVPVDYTRVRYVKKPRGAKPGMVVYDPYETAYVIADSARAEALRVK